MSGPDVASIDAGFLGPCRAFLFLLPATLLVLREDLRAGLYTFTTSIPNPWPSIE